MELLVLVRPDLGEPGGVDGDGVHLVGDAARYGVRRSLPVDVADPRAGVLEQVAAAAPHPHRQLHVLAAPDVHGGVEGADGEEVLPVDGERAADHGGRGEGRGRRLGGPNSIEHCWLEFWLEKTLEFWLEIPYTKKEIVH